MNVAAKSLSLDARFRYLYRPLVRKLAVVAVLTIAIAAAAVAYFDRRIVRSMSATVIANSTEAAAANLQRMADTVKDSLALAQQQLSGIDLGNAAHHRDAFTSLLPFLETYPLLDSINVADDRGNELVVIRDGDGVISRTVTANATGVARWRRWVDGAVTEEWQRNASPTPPAERPWFVGALDRAPGARYWTAPYSFQASGDIGVSVATRWPPDADGVARVIALNASLTDLSRYTVAERPSANGITMIFDEAKRVLGLPSGAGFDDVAAIRAAALEPVDQLNVPVASAAVAAWEERGRPVRSFPFTGPDGLRWWAGIAPVSLDENHSVWTAVVVPQSDLLGGLANLRNWLLIGVALLSALLAAAILGTSMRSIRRQVYGEVEQVERKLGQYRIEQKIGEGGNGTVFRARHALLRRPTALKLMSPAFAGSDAARERFEHEVRQTSRLSHPNTVAIYDFGRTADGTLYYAMELLNGSTLDRLVRLSGPLPPARVIHILVQICGSLEEAHTQGLIHRDVKPSNIILCERGGLFDVVKVLDFGLVQEIADVEGDLTQADVLVGTPFYMAPETIREPGQASARSDLYALGAVGYFLLTGVNVFEGGSAVEICAGHLHDPPVPPSRRIDAPVPADLERIILVCLEKDPEDRPASAEALGVALSRCADAQGWTQQDARSWWQENAAGLSATAFADDEMPMSRTELLIDLDSRLLARGTRR